jgi:hypothetical protein
MMQASSAARHAARLDGAAGVTAAASTAQGEGMRSSRAGQVLFCCSISLAHTSD